MESAQVKLLFLLQSRVGEELHDLEFAYLIRDCLTGRGRKKDRFLTRGAAIDGNDFL